MAGDKEPVRTQGDGNCEPSGGLRTQYNTESVNVLPRLVVLYGSQTGTAEDCAERTGHEALRRRFSSVVVMSCDEYRISDIFDERLILFFIATTGQGENPDNMRTFFRSILSRKLQHGAFSHLEFAVCGLGDSSYQKFNFSAKKVFRRFVQLGAKPILDPVWADEQHDLGVDGLIDPWMDKFWKATSHFTKDPYLPPLLDTMPPPKYVVTPYSRHIDETHSPSRNILGLPDSDSSERLALISPYTIARVLSHDRLTPPDHFQDVRLLRLGYSQQPRAVPGDIAVILPKNTPENVQAFLELFPQIEPDRRMILGAGSAPLPASLQRRTWMTFRDLATTYFDLNFIPKRSFFSVFKHFCHQDYSESNNDDRDSELISQMEQYWEKLDEFSRAAGQPDLVDYAIRPRRTVLEVFEDFPQITARITLQDLFALIPGIRPRYYSVASSDREHPGEIHVLYAVVDYRTMLKKPRRGLCTQYLQRLQQGDTIEMYIRSGTLKFPTGDEMVSPWDQPQRVVMVGPGTGVAPFRAFIEDFAARGGRNMMLFFGCRSSQKDYYFAEEWKRFEARGVLRVVTAFSRDQDHKVYVQQRLRECKDELIEMAEDEDSLAVYICGNAARMVGDVLEALQEMWGNDKVSRMQSKRLIQVEAWA